MNEHSLAQFESRLERLIEGAFASVFSKRVRAQDIALQLARAMEGAAIGASDGDARPMAPDDYVIRLHPDARERLLLRQPTLEQILGQHLVELAAGTGFRLERVPDIRLVPDDTMAEGQLLVDATHAPRPAGSTGIMQRVDGPPPRSERPLNAQLILNGTITIPVAEPVLNLGRSRDNHVVVDDPYVSRHHAQMRLRFGRYTLFDIQSHSGTFVNDVRVREHPLQTGDVIRLGRAQLVYLEDDPIGDSQTHAGPGPDR